MAVHPTCQVVGVIGGKGGVGKSVVAANLAMTFLMEMRVPTLLIDFDEGTCGDQNILLGVRPIKTVAELATYTGAFTTQSVPTLVARHNSGLGFVGAVTSAQDRLNVPPELAAKPVEALSPYYRYIVVDLGSTLGPSQLQMIDKCTALLVVTTPEVLAVNQTFRLMADLYAATVPGDVVQLIINKMSSGALSAASIGQNLNKPVLGVIPQDDVTVSTSLQRSTPFVITDPNSAVSAPYHEIVRKLTGGILANLQKLSRPKMSVPQAPQLQTNTKISSAEKTSAIRGKPKKTDPKTILKLQIHTELIEAMDLKKGIADTQGDTNKEKVLRQKTQQVISQIVDKRGAGLPRDERSQVIKEVLDEALGLGPLEDLLADPTVTEIMVNGSDMIYAERGGRLAVTPITFTSNLQLRNVIERIVTPLGRRIDEKTPYVDARLPDGSRVNAIIEPLAIDGPALTIRKFAKERIGANDYINFGSITKTMMDFLRICAENRLNIVIAGGTGTGKTTLLNVLSSFIPTNERIITIEDAAELQLKQEHIVRLETRPANMEGTGAITIRDLVRNSLRMRPDRIIVGECRDGAALDMLSAMNTGHDGSMTTVHANSPREAVSRLETLCLMAGMDLPVRAIREQIASAIDLIVQISRKADGTRKIISITEIVGIQTDTVTLQEIFRFKEEGFDKNRKVIGQFQATGMIPAFIEKFEQRGIIIPRSLFTNQNPEPAAASGNKDGMGFKDPFKKVGGNKE